MGWIYVGIVVVSFALSYALRPGIPKQVSPKPGKLEGPKAQDGAILPVVFGTVQIRDPNISWFGDKRIYPIKNNGTIVGYKYEIGMEMMLCHGELDAIKAVVVNNKVAWEGEFKGGYYIPIDKPNLFGGDTSGGGVKGMVALSLGGFSSGPHAGQATYVAEQNNFNGGVGPLNFGIATCTFQKVVVGTSPTLPAVSFRVKRIHKTNYSEAQWYDEKAEISTGRNREDNWKYMVQLMGDPLAAAAADYDDSAWDIGPGGVGNAPVGTTGYKTPVVRTRVIGTVPITTGALLWLRTDLGPINPEVLGVQCWHDDSARLWFNGTEITLTGMTDPDGVDAEYPHFNSYGFIPPNLVNPNGPNIVAYRVRDTYDSAGGTIGNNNYIYAGCQIGTDNYVVPPSTDIEVSGNVVNMNGVHIVHEALTNKVWGLKRPDAEMDDTAWRAAADTCYNERLGLSLEWNKQGEIQDFIKEILKHISATLYVDRTTGKFVLKLIRGDYTVGDLLVLDEDSVEGVDEAARRATGELVNQVTVTYTNTINGDAATAPVKDMGLIRAQGAVISEVIDYPGLTNFYDASRAALRNLKVFSAPLLTCTIKAGRKAAKLNPGQPFVFNWPPLQIDHVVMRATEIELGDGRSGRVRVTAVEDEFVSPNYKIVKPGGFYYPPQALAPLPTRGRYWPVQFFDPADQGTAYCCYFGPRGDGSGNVPVMFGYFTEVSPGLFRAISLGTAWFASTFLDGVDPGHHDPSGVSPLIGKRIVIFSPGLGLPHNELLTQRVVIVNDVGGHWVDYGLPSQTFVDTYAEFQEDPSFDYIDKAVLFIENGTALGGKYLVLESTDVHAGTTEIVWSQHDDHIFNTPKQLLAAEEIDVNPVSNDTLTIAVTVASGGVEVIQYGDGFPTLLGSPGLKKLPAGKWEFRVEAAWLDVLSPPSVGSVTKLAMKLFRSRVLLGIGNEFFIARSGVIPNDQFFPTPVSFSYDGDEAPMDSADELVLIPGISTTSTTPITVWLRMSSPARGTYVSTPFVPTPKEGLTASDEEWFNVWIVEGVISSFGAHRRLRVHGEGPLLGIDASTSYSGTQLTLLFAEETSIVASGTPPRGKAISLKKIGGVGQDLSCATDDIIFVALLIDNWQYTGGSA